MCVVYVGGIIKECMWHWCLSIVNVLLIRRFIIVLLFWNIRFDWFIYWFIDWFDYICICYSFSVVYMCFFSHGDVNHNFQIRTTLWYYYTRWESTSGSCRCFDLCFCVVVFSIQMFVLFTLIVILYSYLKIKDQYIWR